MPRAGLLDPAGQAVEHALTAPFDGTVAELTAHEGQQVQVEALLARVEKAAE
jgi:3-methylcrotonyl-CoA carboxylase alpha subunit